MEVREATRADLAAVVALIAEDPGARPEDHHHRAFADIEADPRNEILVLADGPDVLGCLQITYVPGLGRRGEERAMLEAIRIREDQRGRGLGRGFVQAAIDRARARGCTRIQLTSNKERTEAHRFYASLGFARSHDGFKLDDKYPE